MCVGGRRGAGEGGREEERLISLSRLTAAVCYQRYTNPQWTKHFTGCQGLLHHTGRGRKKERDRQMDREREGGKETIYNTSFQPNLHLIGLESHFFFLRPARCFALYY